MCEILQWKDKVSKDVPELSEREKKHLAQEISDVLIYIQDINFPGKL